MKWKRSVLICKSFSFPSFSDIHDFPWEKWGWALLQTVILRSLLCVSQVMTFAARVWTVTSTNAPSLSDAQKRRHWHYKKCAGTSWSAGSNFSWHRSFQVWLGNAAARLRVDVPFNSANHRRSPRLCRQLGLPRQFLLISDKKAQIPLRQCHKGHSFARTWEFQGRKSFLLASAGFTRREI